MTYSDPALAAIIVAMGAITYAIRVAPILLLREAAIPETLRRALRFVPPAVLAALITPDLLLPDGTAHLTLLSPRLLAGALAALIAWRARATFLAIGAGMLALWLFRAVLPH